MGEIGGVFCDWVFIGAGVFPGVLCCVIGAGIIGAGVFGGVVWGAFSWFGWWLVIVGA